MHVYCNLLLLTSKEKLLGPLFLNWCDLHSDVSGHSFIA